MKKRTAILAISLLSAALVALGVFSMMTRNQNTALERDLAVNYQRAFGELADSVSAFDYALQKSLYATSPAPAGAACAEVFAKAMTAKMALEALPFSSTETEQVFNFLSRTGDYAYALSHSAARGNHYTEEEHSNLRALSGAATILSQNLTQLRMNLDSGALTINELGSGISLIEQGFTEIPSHLSNPETTMLEDKEPVDGSAARLSAAKFFGLKESAVYPDGAGDGELPCYYFSTEIDGGEQTVGVSERGALAVSMFSSRAVGEPTISVEDGAAKAGRFLLERGYSSMKETSHVLEGGVLTVNFAYEQDGVICYSDLIKVGVALDTGKVCSFEARGYLLNHRERQLDDLLADAGIDAWVDAETAKQAVPSELSILSESMALIPTPGQNELLCHEFVCETEDGRKYLIYVSAATGEEEQVLILLEDDTGALAI